MKAIKKLGVYAAMVAINVGISNYIMKTTTTEQEVPGYQPIYHSPVVIVIYT